MTRDQTYQRFGPMLTEAGHLVLLDFINELRLEQGQLLITQQELLDMINNHLSHLDEYDWITDGPPGP